MAKNPLTMGDLFEFAANGRAAQTAIDRIIDGETVAKAAKDAGFGGVTYEPEFDAERLKKQLRRTFNLMQDGEWRTLIEIAEATGDLLQSISARLRDFRKDKFGGHTVNRRRRGEPSNGLFEYQLIVK